MSRRCSRRNSHARVFHDTVRSLGGSSFLSVSSVVTSAVGVGSYAICGASMTTFLLVKSLRLRLSWAKACDVHGSTVPQKFNRRRMCLFVINPVFSPPYPEFCLRIPQPALFPYFVTCLLSPRLWQLAGDSVESGRWGTTSEADLWPELFN